ncbi:PLP-dependent transferase [Hortaea werneckii]|nr:PLP-dependent transferase [Hortaea werneckii]
MATNGTSLSNGQQKPLQRADEAEDLLSSVKELVIPFIRAADEDAATKAEGHGLQQPGQGPRSVLVEHHPPKKLRQLIDLSLPAQGQGKEGAMQMVHDVLRYSVNTWDQGFLDKLYAATTPVGLAADLLLSSLNTNLHVYQVSPALTVIEKQTSKALAKMFGLTGVYSGGVSQPGGSAANQSSIVIARNNMFPETKSDGYGGRRFVLFTSAHGHYSLEKAAQMFGFGSNAVRTVPVDERGCMQPKELDAMIDESKSKGETPFYVNATAGTTVLGSYDPLEEISKVCKKHGLWLHVDGSWGSPVIFSEKHRHKVQGTELADSIALCPHKMIGIPVTCSFLLGRDMRQFHKGMTLPAGYLFHTNDEDEPANGVDHSALNSETPAAHPDMEEQNIKEVWDLADLTPQCGRRGDSLKLALTWIYYGTSGIGAYIDNGFESAAHLASLVASNPKFSLVSENPPPCLQVCFYFNKQSGVGHRNRNSQITEEITKALLPKGFMTDYAPGDEGKFFRVVINGQTTKATVEGLARAIENAGDGIKTNDVKGDIEDAIVKTTKKDEVEEETTDDTGLNQKMSTAPATPDDIERTTMTGASAATGRDPGTTHDENVATARDHRDTSDAGDESYRGDASVQSRRSDTASGGPPPPQAKQKPNYKPTGLLAKEANTVAGTAKVLKYHEPPEARKPPPKEQWRLYVFKKKDLTDTIHLHERSVWLVGRDQSITDLYVEHPSISKQHAVLQFRYLTSTNEYGDKISRVKPYLIDLDSANGTKLNGEKVGASRYVELVDGDVVVFGESEREYVMMLPPAEG